MEKQVTSIKGFFSRAEYLDTNQAKEVYGTLLKSALERAYAAVEQLRKPLCPDVPYPRPHLIRLFRFTVPYWNWSSGLAASGALPRLAVWGFWPALPDDIKSWEFPDTHSVDWTRFGIYIVPPDYLLPRDFYNGERNQFFNLGGSAYVCNIQQNVSTSVIADLLRLCGYQPRRVLQIYRGLERIEQWCLARTEGRKRHSIEILKQQKAYLEEIEKEYSFLRLTK